MEVRGPRQRVLVAGVQEAHRIVAIVKDFRIGAGDQVAVYGERVAPAEKFVNPRACED